MVEMWILAVAAFVAALASAVAVLVGRGHADRHLYYLPPKLTQAQKKAAWKP